MRLWSLHPKYLDRAGLLALWREGLLARKVLGGGTRGYTKHPQLNRFKKTDNPVRAVDAYLQSVLAEARKRGYKFDPSKISTVDEIGEKMLITDGQLKYEFQHLLGKLKNRSKDDYFRIEKDLEVEMNPVFKVVEGEIEEWEIV